MLVDLLDEDYAEQTDLVVDALNGIGSVFELQSPTTKNDFCRMFIREGLLDPLTSALLNMMAIRGEVTDQMKKKIVQIVLVFSQVTQSDIHVRNALGTRKIVRRRHSITFKVWCLVLNIPSRFVASVRTPGTTVPCEYVKGCQAPFNECNLARSTAECERVGNSDSTPGRTEFWIIQCGKRLRALVLPASCLSHQQEVSNHIFQTCYNLCRLNKSRQEEAAQAGIIPSLKRVIESKSPLKQFALPILCDLASAGKSCRKLLWHHDGLGMYVKLLSDPYFQASALEAIHSWSVFAVLFNDTRFHLHHAGCKMKPLGLKTNS